MIVADITVEQLKKIEVAISQPRRRFSAPSVIGRCNFEVRQGLQQFLGTPEIEHFSVYTLLIYLCSKHCSFKKQMSSSEYDQQFESYSKGIIFHEVLQLASLRGFVYVSRISQDFPP